jgi:hypothetical protein
MTKRGLDAMQATMLAQTWEFPIGVDALDAEEAAATVEDFVAYVNRLPWIGRLHIHAVFVGGQQPQEAPDA